MASLRVLGFDNEGRPVQFDKWLDDLQLYLQSDSKDSVSLFDLASGVTTAPPATADSATRSHWLTRDTAARLAIRNHQLLAECAHFGQHRTAQALYDAVVPRYSSPATTALGRLLLTYLFPELSAFATIEDLVSHLRTSDARYRATVPAEFLDRKQPLMFITLYFIVTRLPDSLRSVRDHFLSLDPTSLTVDLLEQHLLAGLHLPSFSTNLESTAALKDVMVTTTTPGGVRVRSGSYLLLVSPPVAPDSSVAPPPGSPLPATPSWHALSSSCLWSSQVFASPPALACPALPSVRRGAAARRSSLLLVSPDDCSTANSPLGRDPPVLHLHSDRGGEFSSNLLREFCRGEGILQSFALPDSPQ
ncbi:unnamed protein product [Closterium sp. NIES-53]